MVERGRRLKWHPKRSDLLFVIGATGFFTQIIGDHVPHNSILIASLLLMGVPVAGRVFEKNGKNGGDKP